VHPFLSRLGTLPICLIWTGHGSQKSCNLQLKPALGSTYAYAVDVRRTDLDSGESGVSLKMTLKGVAVDAEKETFVFRITDFKIIGGTQDAETVSGLVKKIVVTTTLDRRGYVLSTKTAVDGRPSKSPPGLAITTTTLSTALMTFPGHPVKVGDSWKGIATSEPANTYRATYRLAGVTHVGGKDFAEVDETIDHAPYSSILPIRFTIDLKSGMPVREVGTMRSAGQQIKVTMTEL
jgi:hypothetical protein